jgi:ketosteroid isomerase-like protein
MRLAAARDPSMTTQPWRCAAAGLAALMVWPAALGAEPAGSAEAAIRKTLAQWADAFNAGRTGEVCGLFASDLRYDYRGFPERGYADVCALLQRSLADPLKRYSYDLEIKEVIASGDMAAVRLVWRLTVQEPGKPDRAATVSKEPGLDIFRRQPDGSWKIVRYLAFEE